MAEICTDPDCIAEPHYEDDTRCVCYDAAEHESELFGDDPPGPGYELPQSDAVNEVIDQGQLAVRRAECAQAWLDQAKEGWEAGMLRGGPLDTMVVPYSVGDKMWSGAWVNDEGALIRVTYEWGLDMSNDPPSIFGEFAGTEAYTDMADAAAQAFAENEREQLAAAEDQVDLEQMPAAEALEFLLEDNARRIASIEEVAGPGVNLTDFFAPLKIEIFVEHLLRQHPKAYAEARLAFENQKSLRLDAQEDEYERQFEERQKQITRAQLQGMPIPPGMQRVHQGRVTLPARRIRRG